MACLAVARSEKRGANSFWRPACGQRALVVAILRLASGRTGRGGDPDPAGAHRRDDRRVLAYRSLGCIAVGTVPLVGELCVRAYLDGVAKQPDSLVVRRLGVRPHSKARDLILI